MFNPETANVLPNGAQIIDRHKLRKEHWVWLAYWEGHAFPYVTWRSTDKGDTYWGHYYETVLDAQTDFNKRKSA